MLALDLVPCLDNHLVRELLEPSIGFPTPEKLDTVASWYVTNASLRLVGFQVDDILCGCIGFEVVNARQAVIHHIAVDPSVRRQGIGRHMVLWLLRVRQFSHLLAETGREAVGFYERCGFRVTSLGEVYPGTERFVCELGDQD